ncbi:MAG: dienelactone hydrolase family protein [Caulobacteraceae bacterium]|nr:dienelactone hydrolase family protein [Caulobacter sp.]
MPVLTRPEGTPPGDLQMHRRGLLGGAAFASGYAAFALSAEAEPIVTDDAGLTTETVSVPEGSGAIPAYVARPQARGRYAAVLVVNEVFGVHEYIRDVCRRFAKLGYVAVAPQFFVRSDPDNQLATTTDFDVIQKRVGQAHNVQVMGDVGATLDWLAAQPFVDRKRLAITGFCWGGAVVWEAATRFPQLRAGAAWYGRLAPPAPGQFMSDDAERRWPLQQVDEMKVPVIGFYGGQDKGIPTRDVDAMRSALAAAGQREDQLITYPEAGHGFHADYRSSYDPAAAKDAWARMLAFFAAHHAAPGASHGFFG